MKIIKKQLLTAYILAVHPKFYVLEQEILKIGNLSQEQRLEFKIIIKKHMIKDFSKYTA